jgi:hypothetical protein
MKRYFTSFPLVPFLYLIFSPTAYTTECPSGQVISPRTLADLRTTGHTDLNAHEWNLQAPHADATPPSPTEVDGFVLVPSGNSKESVLKEVVLDNRLHLDGFLKVTKYPCLNSACTFKIVKVLKKSAPLECDYQILVTPGVAGKQSGQTQVGIFALSEAGVHAPAQAIDHGAHNNNLGPAPHVADAAPQVGHGGTLDDLWSSWCAPPEPQYPDSVFCAAGWGNPIAMLVLRMRFIVPDHPDQHILKTLSLHPAVQASLLKTLLEDFTRSIETKAFKWNELVDVINLLDKNPTFNAELNEKFFKDYGLYSAKIPHAGSNRDIARANADKAIKAIGNIHFPQTSVYLMSLDTLFSAKCQGAPGHPAPWDGTLLCELGSGNSVANYLSRISFEVPQDPKAHAITQLFNIVLAGVAPAQSDKSWASWMKFSAVKVALQRQFAIVNAIIASGRRLTWEDLRGVMVVASFDWTETAIGLFVNPNIRHKGVEVAPL